MNHPIRTLLALSLAAVLASCQSSTPQPATPMNTDFLSLAARRYSVRHFDATPVSADTIAQILEAGRLAPTAINSQPQRIYLIQSPEAVARLGELTPCLYGAPHAFLFCYDDERVCRRGADDNYGDIDVTIVLTHMMLAAADLGIGTCPVGYFDPAATAEAFGLPSTVHPVLLMPFGHAAADATPSPKHTESRPLDTMVESL